MTTFFKQWILTDTLSFWTGVDACGLGVDRPWRVWLREQTDGQPPEEFENPMADGGRFIDLVEDDVVALVAHLFELGLVKIDEAGEVVKGQMSRQETLLH